MLVTYLALCCVTACGECLAWLGNVEQRWSVAVVLFWHALLRGEALRQVKERVIKKILRSLQRNFEAQKHFTPFHPRSQHSELDPICI